MDRQKGPGREVATPATGKQNIDPNLNNEEAFKSLPLGLSTPLEARWARFFNLLHIKWVPGWPLPFWLPFDGSEPGDYLKGFPDLKGLWIAVSEFSPSDDMRGRCREVAARTGHWTHLLVGEPAPRFDVYSWRQGDGRNINGARGRSNFEQVYDPPWVGGCSFDVDFFAHTVPGTSRDVRRALEMVM